MPEKLGVNVSDVEVCITRVKYCHAAHLEYEDN